jgi:oligopeptide/dipeptide ABC transporter ATP-binding protein
MRLIDDVSLSVQRNEIVCLVGESGCGKTITALSIGHFIGSLPVELRRGEIFVCGRNVLTMTGAGLRSMRGQVIGYVFQEPGSALNPVLKIGTQIKEVLKMLHTRCSSDDEVIRLLNLVGIGDARVRMLSYPHQVSGGIRQRLLIAMALAARPKLLIADEPTTALDSTVQAQILDLFRELREKLEVAVLLITHSLGIVGEVGDRVVVMYAGQIVEMAPAKTLVQAPLHPYAKALVACASRLTGSRSQLPAIPGQPPKPGSFPSGCRFHPRCNWARPECSAREPHLEQVSPGHWVRCPYWSVIPQLQKRDQARCH